MRRFNENGRHNDATPGCYQCESSTDSGRYGEADIVVFHLPDIGDWPLPTKYCGQYSALVNLEAPPYFDDFHRPQSLTKNSSRAFLANFDISSTYRLDSDIPIPHFVFWYEEHLKKALFKPMRVPVEERNSEFPVVWIASKCETDNNRIEYVRELMKHIGVKSYGKCLHNADIKKGKSYDEEASRALATHKFHLSFENSNCQDYVTEKLTRTLELGVIPIILGSPQVQMFLPSRFSGLNVLDFDSPKALAEKLHEINKNDTLFHEYVRYKTDPSVISPEFKKRWFSDHRHRACKLCDIAREKVSKDKLKGIGLDLTCREEKEKHWWKNKVQS